MSTGDTELDSLVNATAPEALAVDAAEEVADGAAAAEAEGAVKSELGEHGSNGGGRRGVRADGSGCGADGEGGTSMAAAEADDHAEAPAPGRVNDNRSRAIDTAEVSDDLGGVAGNYPGASNDCSTVDEDQPEASGDLRSVAGEDPVWPLHLFCRMEGSAYVYCGRLRHMAQQDGNRCDTHHTLIPTPRFYTLEPLLNSLTLNPNVSIPNHQPATRNRLSPPLNPTP